MTVQSYQVLQRDQHDRAEVVLSTGQSIWLEVGGPYTIEDAHDVLVGDLWMLAGQSNMEGVGLLSEVEAPSAFVHSLQSQERWAIAEEPLHWLSESPRRVHRQIFGEIPLTFPADRPADRKQGAGLGLPFAKARYLSTGVPIGLIPSAHGGTSMQQWDPALRDEGDDALYGAMLARFHAVGGRVAGVLWYQGESDTFPAELNTAYAGRMQTLVQAIRRDFAQPTLPFYFVQLGRLVVPDPGGHTTWTVLRETQRQLAHSWQHTGMTSAIDLGLDDLIHIDTAGLKRLGKRLARIAAGQPALDLDTVTWDASGRAIHVTVRHVVGGLQAPGRPEGFSLHDSEGNLIDIIYKVTLDGAVATLHLTEVPVPPDATLTYGWGHNPYCNITDAEDMALPAFGPYPLPANGH